MFKDNLTSQFSPEKNLSKYLESIRRFPILTHEEESALAFKWSRYEDRDACERIITSHLRLAASIALKYKGYGLPMAELISEGNLGMMHAIKKFDPQRGFRFSTYAIWWIKASIQEYILRSWSLVKLGTTAAQKKLFFNIRKIKSQIHAFEEGDLSDVHVKEIAKRLQVTENDVIQMNRRLSSEDQSLNVPILNDDKGEYEWQDMLKAEEINQEDRLSEKEQQEFYKYLTRDALDSLTERERYVLIQRRLKSPPKVLRILSVELGVSRERIRQIEVRAFAKLSKTARNLVSRANIPNSLLRNKLGGRAQIVV